jgi:hypothetical protein
MREPQSFSRTTTAVTLSSEWSWSAASTKRSTEDVGSFFSLTCHQKKKKKWVSQPCHCDCLVSYKVHDFLIWHDWSDTVCDQDLQKKKHETPVTISQIPPPPFFLITINAAGLSFVIVWRMTSGSAETPYRFSLESPKALLVANMPIIRSSPQESVVTNPAYLRNLSCSRGLPGWWSPLVKGIASPELASQRRILKREG